LRFLVVLLLILMFAAGVAAVYLWYSMEKPYGAFPPDGVFVEIPHGTPQRGVAHILKKGGLIRSPLAFELYSRRQKKRTLVAGEYFFDHPLSGKEIFWKIANGQVYQRPFTVREGETVYTNVALHLKGAAGSFRSIDQNPCLTLKFDKFVDGQRFHEQLDGGFLEPGLIGPGPQAMPPESCLERFFFPHPGERVCRGVGIGLAGDHS
jgi:cell division protein YceG involved in septum cleavage